MADNKKEILSKVSLKEYFFSTLDQINSEILSPVPREFIFYSSDVLEKYSSSEKFNNDKPLGVKMLELSGADLKDKKKGLKEIGDKSLLMSSFYSDSVEKSIVDKSYYVQLGKTAYNHLNNIKPDCFDIPSFFEQLSQRFEILAALCLRLSLEVNTANEEEYVLKLLEIEDSLSYVEKLILKLDNPKLKAS